MARTYEELKEAILDKFDPDDIVDILGLTAEQVLDGFSDLVVEYQHRFDLEEDEDYDGDDR